MNYSFLKLILFILGVGFSANSYAGIDYSRYGDAPAFFLGWETSLSFAIAALILFFISYNLTNHYKDGSGNINGGGLLITINIAMIICAICSAYLLIPLALIYFLFKKKK